MGDVTPLLAACRWTERRAAAVLRARRIGGTPIWMFGTRAAVMRAPLGRVAIIATWNYPVQLLGVQLVQALAAGNCVTVKPSERAAESQRYLLELARMAGLTSAELTWTEATREAGPALVREGGFDHLIFTGSTGVGTEIAKALAPRLIPATLELSGHDSAIVLEDGDPVLAAETLWAAVNMNAGQTCMAPRRALVHESVYGRFAAALAAVVERGERIALGGGSPSTHRTLIDAGAAEVCHELVTAAVRAGARRLGGSIGAPEGRRFRPTAVIDCPVDAALALGAYFGPVLAVIKVRDADEAVSIHRLVGQHLATAVFTRDAARAAAMAAGLRSSVVTINDAVLPTGHPGVSLGGRGPSGIGVSRGEEGLLAMTRPVVVTRSKGSARLSLRPVTPGIEAGMSRFIRWWYGGRGHPTELPAGGGSASPPGRG